MGSILVPSAAAFANYYESGAGWVMPDSDWAFILDFEFDSSPSGFPSYLSTNPTSSASSVNVFSNGSDQLAVTIKNFASVITYDYTVTAPLVASTWYRLIVARVGNDILQWFGEPGDATATLENTFDVTGFGAVTTQSIKLGSTKANTNQMDGSIIPANFATGTMDQAKANALMSAGGDLGSQAGMTDLHTYATLATSGPAPATIADTTGANDYTLTGALTLGTGPSFTPGVNAGWVSLVPLRLNGTIQGSTLVDIVVRPDADSAAVILEGAQVTTSVGGIITIDNDLIGTVGGLVDIEVALPASTNNVVFKAQTIVDLDA